MKNSLTLGNFNYKVKQDNTRNEQLTTYFGTRMLPTASDIQHTANDSYWETTRYMSQLDSTPMLPEINFNRPGLDTVKFFPPNKIEEQCFSLVHKENLKGCTWQYPANIHKEAPFERGPSVTLLSNEWKGSELYKVLHHEYDHQQIEAIKQFLYIDWHRRFQRRNYFIQFEFINYF